MKSKSVKNSHKAKQAKSAGNGGGPNVPTGKWTQWIEPRGAALLSQTLGPIYFVIKNCGAHTIRLVAQQGDLMDLSPGAVRPAAQISWPRSTKARRGSSTNSPVSIPSGVSGSGTAFCAPVPR
jgi:hypothetical protein